MLWVVCIVCRVKMTVEKILQMKRKKMGSLFLTVTSQRTRGRGVTPKVVPLVPRWIR